MTATESWELVVIGGGPAGLATALEASRLGVSTCLLDERPTLGGQFFSRHPDEFTVPETRRTDSHHRQGTRLVQAVLDSGVDVRTSATVWGIWERRVAFVLNDSDPGTIDARCLVLAPGGYDRPVPFPGWTLPGVMTAGAAHAMVERQRVLPGRQILVAGSGPLMLALSSNMQQYGANIVAILEAAPRPSFMTVARLLSRGRGNEALLLDAVRYLAGLERMRTPLRYSSVVVRAEGDAVLQRAVIASVDRDWRVVPGTERTINVDVICQGFGLLASSELSRLCGCQHSFDEDLGGFIPTRDAWMRTSVPGILVAGDGGAVMGSRTALEEGRLAGISAARELGHISPAVAEELARPVQRRLKRMRRLHEVLGDIFRIGPGIYELSAGDTIVCRCEDVTGDEVLKAVLEQEIESLDVLKSATRAGMGRCQGRMCSRHISATIARIAGLPIEQISPMTARPPIRPVRIGAIAEERPEVPLETHVGRPQATTGRGQPPSENMFA